MCMGGGGCVHSWQAFILSPSEAEIWEQLLSCCWETFRGAVLVSLGDNRNWEAGDRLDALNLFE